MMIKKNEALHGAIVRLIDNVKENHKGFPGQFHLWGVDDPDYLCEPSAELEILYGVGKFGRSWLVCAVRVVNAPNIVGQVNWTDLAKNVDLVTPGQKFVSPWTGITATKPADIGGGVTAAGLYLTKNGRLKYPHKDNCSEEIPEGLNRYFQPRPTVGDFVCYTANRMLSAGTVGRIISENPDDPIHDGSYKIQMLDGNITGAWRYGTGIMTENQVQEVIDFYLADGRPDRVLVKF